MGRQSLTEDWGVEKMESKKITFPKKNYRIILPPTNPCSGFGRHKKNPDPGLIYWTELASLVRLCKRLIPTRKLLFAQNCGSEFGSGVGLAESAAFQIHKHTHVRAHVRTPAHKQATHAHAHTNTYAHTPQRTHAQTGTHTCGTFPSGQSNHLNYRNTNTPATATPSPHPRHPYLCLEP